MQSIKNHLLDQAKKGAEILSPKFIQKSIPTEKMQIHDTLENRFISIKKDFARSLAIDFPAEKNPVNGVFLEAIFQSMICSKKSETMLYQKDTVDCFNHDNRGDITIITGDAGSGKTTFLKSLLAQYTEKTFLFGYNFVFYISCSSVDFDYKGNLLEFLIKELPYLWIKNNVICNAITCNLDEKEKLCILLDGLDINQMNIRKESSSKPETELTKSSQHFIKEILEKRLLPNAKVIIAMRPLELSAFKKSQFYKNCQNKFFIFGLNHENQVNICKHVTCTKFEMIMNFVDEYTDLKFFCSNSTNFLAVSYFLNTFQSTSKNNLNPLFQFPLVQIFVPSLLLITWNFGLKNSKSDITYAVKLAWKMFSNKSMFFSESDVYKEHQHCPIVRIFFQTFPSVAGLNNEFTFTFSAIVSNCLIAMYLFLFQDSFDDYITNIVKPQFLEVDSCFFEITKFLFGLCNNEVIQYLEKLFPGLAQESLINAKLQNCNKVKILKDLVREVMAKKFNPKSKMIAVFSLVFELHDNEFAEEIAEFLPDKIELTESLLKDHFTGLPYVLLKRKREISIIFSSTLTNNEVFKEKIKVLETLENVVSMEI